MSNWPKVKWTAERRGAGKRSPYHICRACILSCSFALRLAGAEYGVQSVSRTVNGPLMEAIAQKISYHDMAAIEMFRSGGQLIGLLPQTGASWECVVAGCHGVRDFV